MGDVDSKAARLLVPVGDQPGTSQIVDNLLNEIPNNLQYFIADFILSLFKCYAELHFAYLEINPLVVMDDMSGNMLFFYFFCFFCFFL